MPKHLDDKPHADAIGLLRGYADAEAKELSEEPFNAGGFVTADRIKRIRAAADVLENIPSHALPKSMSEQIVRKVLADYDYSTPPHLRDSGVLADRIVAAIASAPSTTPRSAGLENEVLELRRELAEVNEENQRYFLIASLCQTVANHDIGEKLNNPPISHPVVDAVIQLQAERDSARLALADEKGRRQRWQKLADQRAIEVADLRTSAASATACSADIEKAWQMLEVCGVPRERARNNLARGIEVLSTRMSREDHFQKAMEADATRYRWLRHDSKELKTEQLKGQFVELYQGAALDEKIDKQMNNSPDGSTQTNAG